MIKKQLKLSILSPVHNEEKIVVDFVDRAVEYLRKFKIPGEVIIVENGSSDRTWDRLQKLRKKYSEVAIFKTDDGVGNKGKALKLGLAKSRGQYIAALDTDLWDEKFVASAVGHLETFDVVIGSKVISGAKDTRPLSSRLMNWGYNFLMKLFFNFQGTETHAKIAFRKEKIMAIVPECRTEDLVFDTELILRAERKGLTKLEIPTQAAEIRPRRFSLRVQLLKTVRNFLILLDVLGVYFNPVYLLLVGAILLGAFFRFYHYADWFFFSVDEEHYSYMTRMITFQHHLPLIGGPISGTRLYMAPWFLYFNAAFFALTNNDPLITGAVFTALEMGVVCFIYLIGKKLFSPIAGAIGGLLYGTSFLLALFDRHYWNITLTPLISAVTFYALLRYREGSRKWLVVTALTVGFGLSATFSTFAIFVFAALVLVILRKWKGLAIYLGIVATMHLTLVLFDLRHDFWLTRALVEFLSFRSSQNVPLLERLVSTLWQFMQTLGKALVITSPVNVSDEISICYQNISHYVPVIWSIILALIIIGRKQWLILLLAAVNIFSIVLFRADPQERHFLPFLPAFFVLAGAFFAKAPLARVIIPVLMVINMLSLLNSYAPHGLPAKITMVKSVMAITKPREFNLSVEGNCHRWGYRYLFSQYNHEPASSYLDQDFSWMYSYTPDPKTAKSNVTIISPDSGKIRVYVQ